MLRRAIANPSERNRHVVIESLYIPLTHSIINNTAFWAALRTQKGRGMPSALPATSLRPAPTVSLGHIFLQTVCQERGFFLKKGGCLAAFGNEISVPLSSFH